MRVVERCLSQFNIEKRRRQRMVSILVVLSMIVAMGVSWDLRLTGITLANEASCGQAEHQHSEECLVEKTLICGYPELTVGELDSFEPILDTGEEAKELICTISEHQHGTECYIDETVLTCTASHEHGDGLR